MRASASVEPASRLPVADPATTKIPQQAGPAIFPIFATVKKTSLLITTIVIAAILAAAWWMSKRSANKSTDPWQLVAPSTAAVIETTNLNTITRLDINTDAWMKFVIAHDSTLIGTNNQFLVAFQQAGNTNDILILFQPAKRSSSWFDELRESMKARARQRTYEAVSITDLSRNDSTLLSFAELNGITLLSPKAVLIENAIRQFRSRQPSFRNAHHQLFQLSSVSRDDGNLYINWSQLNRSLNADTDLRRLCHAMLFDLRWSKNTLLMNGFAADTSVASNNVLSLFREQKPVAIGLKPYLPDQFQTLIHFGMSNPVTWNNRRNTLAQALQPAIHSQLNQYSAGNSFNNDDFFKGVDNELALCTLPGGGEVLIVELKEITKSVAQLEKLGTALRKNGKYEHQRYSGSDIHQLLQTDLAYHLFWPIGFHSDELFWTLNGNILMIAGTEHDIRTIIDLNESESTLNKSLQWSKFFESTLQESNLSIFTNGESPDHDQALRLFQGIKAPSKFSFQFHALEDNYYSSAVMEYETGASRRDDRRKVRRGEQLDGNTIAGPWLVRNHTDKSFEVLIQDSGNKLHLISLTGKEVWSVKLDAAITSQVEQVDLFKNGKLQYLFLAGSKLFIIDRLGREVEGYPKTLPMTAPAFMSLVDYDNTRNYRVAIANHDGDIMICDLNGRALEGWNPRKVNRDLADAPRHFRIRSRDYFGAITVAGEISLFNRRGDMMRNFPVKLNGTPSGTLFGDGTNIVAVSSDGKLMRIGTDGKLQDENALLRNNPAARFQLVATPDQSDFIVVRLDQGTLAGFNAGGSLLFETPNPASDQVKLAYHRFGKGSEVVAVFDADQKLFFALDAKGKMLIPQPLQADAMPQVYFNRTNKGIIFVIPFESSLSFVTASF